MASVSLTRVIEKMKLENLTPEIDVKHVKITQPDINRPALQLAGYFEHFDATRLQIIGFVEYTYMEGLTDETRKEAYDKLMSYDIPCIVFSRDLKPDPIFLETAIRHEVPVLSTKKSTSDFMSEIIRWLNVKLAPCISVHGVLVDVYGEGVLITGESGIGKSEAALELIKRGHRLVTDDVVELRKVSDDTLVGSAPDITKHFIELRGIGIVDVKALFGASSVKDTQTIDLVIRLEDWDKDKEYDRLGLEESYTEYLGNKVVCHNIPIRPGRNLAVICETAAVNHRQKKSAVRLIHKPSGIVVACQEERSQVQNREKCMQMLASKLYQIEQERIESAVTSERRSQVGTGMRNERIRTYNFPQGRVTDHRIGLTLYKIDSIMDGALDELIDALVTADQAEKLQSSGEA